MLKPAVNLVAADGVERIGGDLLARTEQPWLRIADADTAFRGHWISLRYRLSFFDDPVRPLLRFQRASEDVSFQALNGPVLGAARAIVRAPDDTVSISISPAAKVGRFDFVVDEVERVSRAALLADGMRREPGWALIAAGARLIQARQEAEQDLKFALGSTSLADYDAWHRSHARPLDLGGIDRPRSDWRKAPRIRLIMDLDGNDTGRLDASLQALGGQAYSGWTLHAVVGARCGADLLARFRAAVREEPRVSEISPTATFDDLTASPSDRIAVLGTGDIMPDYALAAVAEALAADPEAAVVYGDEDAVTSNGLLHSPLFKPDWSPAFQAASAYMGRLTCIRRAEIAQVGCARPQQLIAAEMDIANQVVTLAGPRKIAHLRRILYRRRRERDEPSGPSPANPPAGTAAVGSVADWPTVAIIVPSRDQADHLRRCITSLRETTDYPCFEIVVVDNGSTARDAVALLDDIANQRQCTVLKVPGAFNYSALSNHGVANSRAELVVLLNNDVAVINAGWLQSLAAWAKRGDVGAVGAKLLYPNGRIQHAGIVMGSGGRAGHLYKGMERDEPGYLHRLQVSHEVAAVTGACLAVERAKFEAIGGLDAANLPVELSDVDLCLRLAERGWRTIWTPDSLLCHVEGATRRLALYPAKTYGPERRYFVRRWAHVIRDDPYFHPALSLSSHRPALARS